jgi:SAM-dependent methyltransferase
MIRDQAAYQGPPWELLYWRRLTNADMHPTDPRYGLRMAMSLDCVPMARDAAFSVLDVGCGIGLYAFDLCRRWPQATVHGVDVNAGQIAYAAAKAGELGLAGRLSFAVGDAETLDGLRGPFDVILATEIVEHLERPVAMLSRLRALCRDEGWLVLSAPGGAEEPGHADRAYRQLAPDGSFRQAVSADELDPSAPIFEMVHRHFGGPELAALLEATGWRPARQLPIRFDHEELARRYPRLGRAWRRLQVGRAAPLVARPTVDRVLNIVSRGRFADSHLVVCRPDAARPPKPA